MAKSLDKKYVRVPRTVNKRKKVVKAHIKQLDPLDVPYKHRNTAIVGKEDRTCFFCKEKFVRRSFFLHKCKMAKFSSKVEYEALLPEGDDGLPQDPLSDPYTIFHGGIDGLRNGVLKGHKYPC